jgi:hypothetical protein
MKKDKWIITLADGTKVPFEGNAKEAMAYGATLGETFSAEKQE